MEQIKEMIESEELDAPVVETEPVGDETIPEEKPAQEPVKPETVQSFFDPSKLSPELKEQWSNMHRAYTKKMEQFKDIRGKAEIVDRFQSDPEFAMQTLQQAANQMGMKLTKAQTQEAMIEAATRTSPSDVPQEVVNKVKSRLSPELQWMAEEIAAGQWEAAKLLNAPREEEELQRKNQERTSQYENLASELGQKAPGWEEKEDDMNDILNFLTSSDMTHKIYGSKLELLYNLATGNAQATKTAIDRMAGAARSKTSTSQTSSRGVSTNYTEQVRKAKTRKEAMQIAAQVATEELEKQGVTFN